jgi:hypothetical protein
MKTSLLIITTALMISISTSGQAGKDVPANIKAAFSQKFPTATKVTWGAESAKEWEAEFTKDGKEYSANFDLSAKWLETEYEITEKEIPAPVKATIDKEFAGYKNEESAVSETSEAKLFEFVLSKGKEKYDVSINAAGKVVTKELVKEEKEDENK